MKPESYKDFLKSETSYLGVDLGKEGEDKTAVVGYRDGEVVDFLVQHSEVTLTQTQARFLEIISKVINPKIKHIRMRGFHGLR